MDKVLKFEGIGTKWWIEIFDDINSDTLSNLEAQVLSCVKTFEIAYSRFLEESLITKLNNEKVLKNPPSELINLINLGDNAKKITKGHFNLAVGKVLEENGYDAHYSFESKKKTKFDDYLKFSSKEIVIGRDARIDLGGVGKGFLIDKVKKLIKKNNIDYFFINAGGDIYATSNFGDPIGFALENPFNDTEMIGEIYLKNKGIASSSGTKRRWKDKNTKKDIHHLFNMNTQENVSEVAGVYTLGRDATSTDISSTAFFVSPRELHPKIAENYGVEYLIVYSNGSFDKSKKYSGTLFT